MSIQEIIKEKLLADNNVKQFNVFTTLLKSSDEVYLHSRFITSLLDPNGTMNMGHLPLKLFMQCLGSKFTCGPHTIVTPNCTNHTEEGDIDILIEDTVQNFAIIIENKIYSGDNNSDPECGQLQKYFWQVENGKLRRKGEEVRERENKHPYPAENIEVYYLTPNLHPASKYSTSYGQGNYRDLSGRVKCIGYGEEQVISKWLNQLLNEDSCCEPAKEAIRQYLKVVEEVVGDVRLNEELTNIVSEHFEEVRKIGIDNLGLGEKVKDVKWHVIVDFLNELDDALRQNDLIIQDRIEPMHLAVTDLIHHPTKHTPIYYRIERANIVWTLEANDRCHEKGFFLGIDNAGNGWKEIIHLSEIDSKLPRLNLWDFTDGDTISLLDKSSHVAIAKTYADCVKEYLLQYELS